MSTTLTRIQIEHRYWSERNFGIAEPWQPLLGIVEEFGEWWESQGTAEATGPNNLTLDAVADMAIFSIHYCSTMGWRVEEIWELRETKESPCFLDGIIGRLAHHHLKLSQNIRGTVEEHRHQLQTWLSTLFHELSYFVGGDEVFFALVSDTWDAVKQRDWNAERTKVSESGIQTTGAVSGVK